MVQKKAKTTDDLSFGEAFKIFRKKHGGDGGRFRWKGNVYTTDFAKPKTKSKSSAPATSKRPQARTPAATSSGPSKPKAPTMDKPPSAQTDMAWTTLMHTVVGNDVRKQMGESMSRMRRQGRPGAIEPRPSTSTGPSKPKAPTMDKPPKPAQNPPKPAQNPPKAMTSMSMEASGFKTMGALSGIDSRLPLQGNRRLFPSAETTVKRPKAPAKPSVSSVLKKFLSQMQRNRRRPGSSNPR